MKNSANKNLRKVLSIIICLALVMSYVPMVSLTAFAADGDTTVDSSLASYYGINKEGFGGKDTIIVDGYLNDWESSMLIAQGTANDDPRVYRPNSMFEVPIDLYALYASYDDSNLYLMWEMTNVQDVVAPSDAYPLSQGVLFKTMNVPFYIAIDTGDEETAIGNNAQLIDGGTIKDSGITISESFNKLIEISTNGTSGPFVYGGNSSGLNSEAELSLAQTGIGFNYNRGILSEHVYGIDKAYGEYNNRVVGDMCDENAAWVDFNTLGHSSSTMDFFYEMSIPLDVLGVTADDVAENGLGVMLIATIGKSAMDCLPYDLSMNDNADKEDVAESSGQNNSFEKSDEDYITTAFARVAVCCHNFKDGTCKVCGGTCETLGHDFVDGTCKVCGGTCETLGHDFVDGTCTVCGGYEPATDSNGDGYYEIGNAGNLFWLAEQVNYGSLTKFNAVLTSDLIIPDSKQWMPINLPDGIENASVFDGNGHSITLNQSSGLFSRFNYSVFRNVILYGTVTANTTDNIGAVVGSAYRTTIQNVISYVDVTNSNGNAGGLAGYFGGKHSDEMYSKIENCAVYADISGTNTGGFIGEAWNGTQYFDIANCTYVGDITGTNAGAIVGYQNTDSNTCVFTNIYWCEADGIGFYGKRDTSNQVYTNTMAKTPEQFASGEVAYLLQQGNTEQVWGQDSNQEGATPILDSTGLYKVVTVGETGNYSVANVGDTNGDGTVDVEDYQALVNKALADDHEQIETASYDDIVKYDLDGDGYLDVLDASLMHLFINGFKTVDVYAVGDYDINGVAFEEADVKSIKHAIENPEKLATYKKYASDINGDGKVSEADLTELTGKYGEITGTECADNVKVYYRWGNSYSTCTATAMCTLCGEKVATETVKSSLTQNTPASCTETGVKKYKAVFTNELFETQNRDVPIEKLGHQWENGSCKRCGTPCEHEGFTANYVWASDNSSCTATATCKTCNNEVYSEETADVALDETQDGNGNYYWRATFENTVFEEQSQLSYSVTYSVTDNTYYVYDANGLFAWNKAASDLTSNLTSNLTLEADIDMANAGEWTPVGDVINPYAGTINGNGHTISNIKLSNRTGNFNQSTYVGFVGTMSGGEMKDITFDCPTISMPESYSRYSSEICVGIVADMYKSTMTNVLVTGMAAWDVNDAPEGTYPYVGVLAGYNGNNSTIKNCHVENGIKLSVTRDAGKYLYVGGIAGNNHNSVISGCTSAATISVTGSVSYEGFVGGIVGYGWIGSNTNGCVYYGELTATLINGTYMGIGGIAGSVDVYSTEFNVVGCYVTGTVTGGTDNAASVGAIVGYTKNNYSDQVNSVKSCYWSGNDGLSAFGDYTGESTCYKVGTEVDGKEVTWNTAVDAMNGAIKTWNESNDNLCNYHYEINTGDDAATLPLILKEGTPQ